VAAGALADRYAHNIAGVIDRWERLGSAATNPLISDEERQRLRQQAANPAAIAAWYDRWSAEDADVNAPIDENDGPEWMRRKVDDILEVVELAEEEEDDDEEMEEGEFDFIVADDEVE
jgi:hypothetical protein